MAGRDKRELSSQEKKVLSRIIVLIGLLGVLWFLFAPGRGYFHLRSLKKQVNTLTSENQALEEHNTELIKEIKRLKTDDAYLEELARKKYGMLKENETVYEFNSSKKKE